MPHLRLWHEGESGEFLKVLTAFERQVQSQWVEMKLARPRALVPDAMTWREEQPAVASRIQLALQGVRPGLHLRLLPAPEVQEWMQGDVWFAPGRALIRLQEADSASGMSEEVLKRYFRHLWPEALAAQYTAGAWMAEQRREVTLPLAFGWASVEADDLQTFCEQLHECDVALMRQGQSNILAYVRWAAQLAQLDPAQERYSSGRAN